MKKIGFFLDSLNRITGGHKRRVYMANELVRRGYQVDLIHRDDYLTDKWKDTIKANRVIMGIRREEENLERLNEDYDVLFIGDGRWFLELFLRTKVPKKVWMMQGAALGYGNIVTPLVYKMIKRVYSSSDIIKLSFTTPMQRWLKLNFKQDSILARGGVDTNHYKLGAYKRENLALYPREHFKIDKAFLGSILVTFKRRGWKLRELSGKEKDLPKLYQRAKLLLSLRPTLEKGVIRDWNNPAAEAMACGCSVLITPQRGTEDYVFKNKTGFISQKGVKFLKELSRVTIDDEERERVSKRGHKLIQNFSYKKLIDIVEKEIIKK